MLAIRALEPGKALLWATAPKVGRELTGDKPGKLAVLLAEGAHQARELTEV